MSQSNTGDSGDHTTVGTAQNAVSAPRTGRWVTLAPVVPQYMDFLYQLATDEKTGFRWRLTGSVPPPDSFQRDLWKGVFSQFVILERRTSQPIGTVMAYNVELHHGFGFLAAAVIPQAQGTGIAIEATDLFMGWLFMTYDLRKIYLEVPEFNISQISNGVDGLLVEEGCLREHMYYGGRHWDRYIFAIYRSEYLSRRNNSRGRRIRAMVEQ